MLDVLTAASQLLKGVLPTAPHTVALHPEEEELTDPADLKTALRSVECPSIRTSWSALNRSRKEQCVSGCTNHPQDYFQDLPSVQEEPYVEAVFRQFQVEQHGQGASFKAYHAHGSLCTGQKAGANAYWQNE